MGLKQPPTAIMATDDLIGLGVLSALSKRIRRTERRFYCKF